MEALQAQHIENVMSRTEEPLDSTRSGQLDQTKYTNKPPDHLISSSIHDVEEKITPSELLQSVPTWKPRNIERMHSFALLGSKDHELVRPCHIDDRPPSFETTRALYQSCQDDKLPTERDVNVDFGFSQLSSREDRWCLLRLYQILIDKCQYSHEKIHDLLVNNFLISRVLTVFHELPEQSRDMDWPRELNQQYLMQRLQSEMERLEIRSDNGGNALEQGDEQNPSEPSTSDRIWDIAQTIYNGLDSLFPFLLFCVTSYYQAVSAWENVKYLFGKL